MRKKESLIENTIAELAFLFVFSMFIYFSVARADNGERDGDLRRALRETIEEITPDDCGCDITLERVTVSGALRLRVLCGLSSAHSEPLSMFPNQSAELDEDARLCVDRLWPRLIEQSMKHEDRIRGIRIVGHASEGWEEYLASGCRAPQSCNMQLSRQRSEAIYRLIENGLHMHRPDDGDASGPGREKMLKFFYAKVRQEARGELEPIDEFDDLEMNEDVSRRVEFLIDSQTGWAPKLRETVD